MIQIFAHQYRETLTNEQVNAMDWTIKVKYKKKKNQAATARQINYVFQ